MTFYEEKVIIFVYCALSYLSEYVLWLMVHGLFSRWSEYHSKYSKQKASQKGSLKVEK